MPSKLESRVQRLEESSKAPEDGTVIIRVGAGDTLRKAMRRLGYNVEDGRLVFVDDGQAILSDRGHREIFIGMSDQDLAL